MISTVFQQVSLVNISMLRRLSRRTFVRNVAILASGSAFAQVLMIAASPILTRLYGPDAFGSFGLLMTLSTTLVVVSGLRYELAVVPAKDDSTAANLLILSCGIVLLMSGLAAALVAAAGDRIGVLLDHPDIGVLLWWLPLLILGSGTYQAMNYWALRRRLYKQQAVSRVAQAVAAVGLQMVAGIASLGAAGLIGGRMVGSVIGGSLLTGRILRADGSLFISAMKFRDILKAAKANSQFPKYNMPHNLINSLSKASVPYTLAPFFGIEVVGFYYLAERVMRTPSSFVINSIRRVFYQRASELHNQGKSFHRLMIRTMGGLFSIGIIPLILLLFFGPDLFSIVFGSAWRKAGSLAQWLANWWFIAFVAAPASEALTVLNLQKYLLLYQIALSISRILAILIGAMIGDEVTAIAACSVVSAVFNLALMVSTLLIVRRRRLIPRGQQQT